MSETSRVIKCARFRWEAVPVAAYKPDRTLFKDVTRQTIAGEGAGDEAGAIVTQWQLVKTQNLELKVNPSSNFTTLP